MKRLSYSNAFFKMIYMCSPEEICLDYKHYQGVEEVAGLVRRFDCAF